MDKTNTSTSTIDSTDSEASIYQPPLSLAFRITIIINLAVNKTKKAFKNTVKSPSDYIFSSHKIPSISIESYLNRIVDLSSTHTDTDAVLISALVYIDRICQFIPLLPNNSHKVLLIAMLLSIKYHTDKHYSNSSYAKIGGLPLNELNMLESEFLHLLGYQLYIADDVYRKYESYLMNMRLSD